MLMILKRIKENKKMAIFLVVISIIAADRFISFTINKQLLADDYYFESRLKEVDLDLQNFTNKNNPPKCKLEYKLWIYAYQTCFQSYANSKNWNEHGYYYVYHQTKPKVTIFPANSKDNYYFHELYAGKTLYHISRDGTVRKTIGGYQ